MKKNIVGGCLQGAVRWLHNFFNYCSEITLNNFFRVIEHFNVFSWSIKNCFATPRRWFAINLHLKKKDLFHIKNLLNLCQIFINNYFLGTGLKVKYYFIIINLEYYWKWNYLNIKKRNKVKY